MSTAEVIQLHRVANPLPNGSIPVAKIPHVDVIRGLREKVYRGERLNTAQSAMLYQILGIVEDIAMNVDRVYSEPSGQEISEHSNHLAELSAEVDPSALRIGNVEHIGVGRNASSVSTTGDGSVDATADRPSPDLAKCEACGLDAGSCVGCLTEAKADRENDCL